MAVLITGATGHLGPQLVAELLRAADFDRLYVIARRTSESAVSRVETIERTAVAQLMQRGVPSSGAQVIPLEADLTARGLALHWNDMRRIREQVTVIVHAAADTRFAAPLDELRAANVHATLAVCGLAARCEHLRQLLYVSTACAAGRRTGEVPEQLLNDSAGFANAYEQTKWEAEQLVAASGLPVRIARLSTCAGSHWTGYIHRFGALHHLLHWMARGLVPMVPGTAATPIDVLSTDVAAEWLARAAARYPQELEVCHVALGKGAIPLGALLDFVIPLLDHDGRARGQRPMLVDKAVFESFNHIVRVSGDALMARVQTSAAAMLPSLLHPKQYATSCAERCWGGSLPHPDWRLLLSRVIAFGQARRWGFATAGETCHA